MKREKTLAQLKKETDRIFSVWVRQRDSRNGKNVCFTCRRVLPVGELQAGHFVSRVYSSLRYCEKNVWPQCKSCNIFRYGRMDVYAERLVKKFGPEILTWFQKEKKKFTQRSKKDYQALIKKYGNPELK